MVTWATEVFLPKGILANLMQTKIETLAYTLHSAICSEVTNLMFVYLITQNSRTTNDPFVY